MEMEMSSRESQRFPEDPRQLVKGARGREARRRYQCARCAHPIQLSEALITQGCAFCGAKAFRFTTLEGEGADSPSSNPTEDFENDAPDVIRLVQPGIYQINLEALGSLMKDANEPLVLSAKRGIFRISFRSKEGASNETGEISSSDR